VQGGKSVHFLDLHSRRKLSGHNCAVSGK